MTKVIKLDESVDNCKKIEFSAWLHSDLVFGKVHIIKPHLWREIYLLQKNYRGSGMDLMLAKHHKVTEEESCLYIGHFNDGVV